MAEPKPAILPPGTKYGNLDETAPESQLAAARRNPSLLSLPFQPTDMRTPEAGVDFVDRWGNRRTSKGAFPGIAKPTDPGELQQVAAPTFEENDLEGPATDFYQNRIGEQQTEEAVQEAVAEAEETGDQSALQMLGVGVQDIATGTLLEGPGAIVRGLQSAVNEATDLTDALANSVEQALPNLATTIYWEGFDGDAATPAKIELITGSERDKRLGEGSGAVPKFKVTEAGAPSTTTGQFIEKISQFLGGWAGGGAALKGWKTASRAGKIGKAMAQGAIADFAAFDAQEARLSNMLNDLAPDLANPVTEYLAADADDGEYEGRMKNAIEGLGLGVATDAMIRGIKAVKALRNVKKAAQAQHIADGGQIPIDLPAARADTELAQIEAEVTDLLRGKGLTGAEMFETKVAVQPTPKGKKGLTAEAKAVKAGEIEPNSFEIPFHRITTEDDVKKVIATMLERNAGDVEKARRGEVPWAQTKEEAAGLDWIELAGKRRVGEAMNAAEIVAFKRALTASGERLLLMASNISEKGARASVPEQLAFRRMLSIHQAIQAEFMGARAEAGRALQAFQIDAPSSAAKLRNIDALLMESGGQKVNAALARKLLAAADKGDVAFQEMARRSGVAKTQEAVRLFYINSLLSGLATPVANIIGNSGATMHNVFARAVMPHLPRLSDEAGEVEVGEAMAMLHGMSQATKDMFRASYKEAGMDIAKPSRIGARIKEEGIWRAAGPRTHDALPAGIRDGVREEALTTSRPLTAESMGVKEDTVLGRGLDILQLAIESPSNFNAAADDFFKAITARAELHAQALRIATKEARAGALPDQAAFQARMSELIETPTERMLEAAEMEMAEMTFTRDVDGIARFMTDIRRWGDEHSGPLPLGTMAIPFVKTPANIISMAVRNSPYAMVSKRFREDLAAGGERAEIAKSKAALGTLLFGAYYQMAAEGTLTGGGPANTQQRQAMSRSAPDGSVNWQPYSVRVDLPDGSAQWVSIERLDPIATMMRLSADMQEIVANTDWDEASAKDLQDKVALTTLAFGNAAFNKTMLKDSVATIGVLTGQADIYDVKALLAQKVTGFVPGLVRNVRRSDDPIMRETITIVDALKNSIPGLSTELAPQLDLWGNERTYQTSLGQVYDAVSPVKVKEFGGTAIDQEILHHGAVISMPKKEISMDGVRVSLAKRPDIYADMVRLAGKPAFEELEAIVTGNSPDSEAYYALSGGPNGDAAEFIKDTMARHRKAARDQIIEMYGPELEKMRAETLQRVEDARGD